MLLALRVAVIGLAVPLVPFRFGFCDRQQCVHLGQFFVLRLRMNEGPYSGDFPPDPVNHARIYAAFHHRAEQRKRPNVPPQICSRATRYTRAPVAYRRPGFFLRELEPGSFSRASCSPL